MTGSSYSAQISEQNRTTDAIAGEESNHEQISDFYKSVIACIKALSNDDNLTVSVGTDTPADEYDVHLPLIEDESSQSLKALIRGLGDSFAMMRLHHDALLHSRLAPEDEVADRLFTLFERERFEAVGGRQFRGVGRNLQTLWNLGHGADALERFGASEQLELVLSCLCREQMSDHPLPVAVKRSVNAVRGPVEDLLDHEIAAMAQVAENQDAYAEHALAVIKKLGFDISPKSTDSPDDNATPHSQENAAGDEALDEALDEETDEVDLQQEDTTEPQAEPQIDENAELTEQAELVRNAEFDPLGEDEPEDPEDSVIADAVTVDELERPDAKLSTYHYNVFNTEADEVCKADSLLDLTELKRLRRELDVHIKNYEPLIGQLANRLQQVLLSRQQRNWEQDRDEGEIDPQRLTRLIIDPLASLIYRVESETTVRDTTVCLLIDNSRSMFGKPIATAASCADLITRVLERCGVSTEVLGFTTVSMYGGAVSDAWREQGCPADAGRINTIRHIIYKSASSSWKRSRDNFGLMLDKELLKQNIDGEALLWAQQRLLARPEKRRILLVISDGRPSDSSTLKANHENFLLDHLDYVIRSIEKRAAIELVAIGIGHKVSNHYRRSFMLDDVEQLGPLMLSELSRLLRN